VVLATHDTAFGAAVADRVLCVGGGRVVARAGAAA